MTELTLQDAVVIVVEDNPDDLLIIQQLLRRAGIRHVNGRASGRQFFKLLESHADKPVHIVLLDIQIPGEDGYTILKQIREHPRLRETRVIAVTANALAPDEERASEAGFDGFLGKPLNRDRFGEQIARIVAGEHVWEAH